jgi:hypothetical protein
MSSVENDQRNWEFEAVRTAESYFKWVVEGVLPPDGRMPVTAQIAVRIWRVALERRPVKRGSSLGGRRKLSASSNMLAGIQKFDSHNFSFGVEI